MSEPPTYTVAKDLNEKEGLREIIDASGQTTAGSFGC
jgi:hypothetical protein